MVKKLIFTLILPLFSLSAVALDLGNLTLCEKIGQMIIVALVATPLENKEFMANHLYHLEPRYAQKMIMEHHIGGLLFLGKSSPLPHLTIVNQMQAVSRYPLLIFQDAEWGLAMRMTEEVMVYPKAMTLGALSPEDDHLIYRCGQTIGTQLLALGIHSSISPVCDVNNNPQNPIINCRSFGENPHNVARKALLMMQGLLAANTLPCAKHFPGHGNTSSDSHKTLPFIAAEKESLEKIEFIPFRTLIKAGLPALMNAHLDVPALTGQRGMPTSLSELVIQEIVRKELGFQKLIITDALGMEGIRYGKNESTIIIDAIKAGNDILLCPVDVPGAIASIKNALTKGIISVEEIDEHVARIIAQKESLHIERSLPYIKNSFNNPVDLLLKKDLYRAAITLARNDHNRLPLKHFDNAISLITIGATVNESFLTTVQKYISVTHYSLLFDATESACDNLYQKLTFADHIIIALHLTSRSGMIETNNQADMPPYVSLINQLGKKVTLVLFGNPYNLASLPASSSTLVAYENEPEAQEAAALALVGMHNPQGQLPVTASNLYPAGLSLRY